MKDRKGAIAWMATNPVAANLLMLLFLLGGILMALSVRQEVFPDFKLDTISIQVPYPGASPREVEQGIILATEEAVRGVDGVKRIDSVATEGLGSIYAELEIDARRNRVLTDVKNAVDGITSYPEQSERPTVSLAVNRVEVISVILYGPRDEAVLRTLADQAREDLLAHPLIEHVELRGARSKEIEIEVPEASLRSHGLTLRGVADKVAATALELSGGSVRTPGGELLLRTSERRERGEEFEDIPIVTTESGGEVRLGDIARVQDTFAETDDFATFDGQTALMLRVFRSSDIGPIEVSGAVKSKVAELQSQLPEGVHLTTWVDWSRTYRERLQLLLRNGYLGLMLVLLVLGLFLELRLAFWVTLGIPVSFLGTLLLMPSFDVSVNMISMFAFIVTLGMVVDDAIVVGENIHELRQKGVPFVEAAIRGAREVAVPVTFSIATTIAAFTPMFFVPGFSGKLYRVIPTIVISTLVISLIESLFILPAHLAHLERAPTRGWYAVVHGYQQKVGGMLERFIRRDYAGFIERVVRRRYLSLAVGIAVLALAIGWVAGGRIAFRYMPNIDGDVVIANVELPHGSSLAQARQVQRQIVDAANEVIEEHGGDAIARGVFAQIGRTFADDPGKVRGGLASAHLGNVQVLLVPNAQRDLVASEFARMWEGRLGRMPGLESLSFKSDIGPTPGAPIDVELTHNDLDVLEQAAVRLGLRLREYAGVKDIDDGYALGKPQLEFTLEPEGAALGLTVGQLAQQVRSAFHGAEALRQQEGRDEVKVVARLPGHERTSRHAVEELLIRTPSGGQVPLDQVANIERSRSRPEIRRARGRRAIHVRADVVQGVTSPGEVLQSLQSEVLPELKQHYPGLEYEFGGENREQREVLQSLLRGGQIAALVIFALLAIPFKSYVQPLIVMAAIPFGLVGALIGHIIMGYELSIVSVMGMVALTGVVVNDSLVLVDAANRNRRAGMNPHDAICGAGTRRFRPILLTSLTTFFGLTPMIVETSVQARFLIPMAISLGFGVLFATAIILLLVPALYLMVEDFKRLLGKA